jgi:ABC-type transporter Mla MlaB component
MSMGDAPDSTSSGPPGRGPTSWRIKPRQGFTLVELVGDLDERTDLDLLRAQLKGTIVINLSEVRRINSAGTREWINFIRVLSVAAQVTLTHCSPATVQQLNAIYNFRGAAKIRSVLVPYWCDACDLYEDKLCNVEGLHGAVPSLPPERCHKCGGPLECEELFERYFQFLKDG